MATKFDPKEYAKQKLIDLCTKYFPKDSININAGRKGFRIGENMNNLIEQAKEVIYKTENNKYIIPDSTANFFRYGVILQDIFQNLNEYQTISYVKTRTRRGYRKELEVVDFNLKKIDLTFKKSSNPPVKTQKDEKLLKSLKKHFLEQLKENNYQRLFNDVTYMQSLFIVPETDGYRFFNSFHRVSENLIEAFGKKKELEKEYKEIKDKIDKNNVLVAQLSPDLSQIKQDIDTFRKKSGFQTIIDEKEALMSDPNLSMFLKVLTTSLERYVKLIERRENRVLEQKEDFLGLILEPTRYKGLNEDLWKQIVFVIETHGFELCGGKTWFKFNDPAELRRFFLRKDILTSFARLRNLEDDLEALELTMLKDPYYSDLQDKVDKFKRHTQLLHELKERKADIISEKELCSQEIKNEIEKALLLLN